MDKMSSTIKEINIRSHFHLNELFSFLMGGDKNDDDSDDNGDNHAINGNYH